MAALDFFSSGMMNAAEKMLRKQKATDGRTNPNAKPAKQGKNAKSSKAGKRAANAAMQQQMQADQFKFLQDNIFDRTGATRRTMSGQLERDVPQGMDYFKNTGPDRPEVATRQARLDNQGLKNPWFAQNAQEAVDLARRKQAEPSLFGSPSTPSMDQMLRTPTKNMDVFSNPDGSFTRSRPNPYGSARALFEQTPQTTASAPAQTPQVSPGPVQQLFTPTAQQQPDWSQNFMQSFSQLPNAPQAPDVNNMTSGPARSYAQVGKQDPQEPFFGNFTNPLAGLFDSGGVTNPRSGQTAFNQPAQPQYGNPRAQAAPAQNSPYRGPSRQGNTNTPTPFDNPYSGGPSASQRFTLDPTTSSIFDQMSVTNLPQVTLPNMPYQRDKVVDPNNPTAYVEQPNWWDNMTSMDWWNQLFANAPASNIPGNVPLGY